MAEIVPLPEPEASAPILFGETAKSALLPWSWAAAKLTDAHNYWVVTVRANGRPHTRPLWCVWLADGLWFTTGSQAVRALRANAEVSINLEDGNEVLILEGVAEQASEPADLDRFVEAYNAKYGHTARPADGEIADAEGPIGPAYRVRPRVIFGWHAHMTDPTRWTFPAAEDAP
jgi:hypothetical protein